MAKEKDINQNQLSYEKQRFLENGDTVHHFDAHSSIDSNEHNILYGPWPIYM